MPFIGAENIVLAMAAGFCAGTMALREISNYALMKKRFLYDSENNRKEKSERITRDLTNNLD